MRAASRKERTVEQDKRPRYKGICPECGRELWICKSILMEMGINQGGRELPALQNLPEYPV